MDKTESIMALAALAQPTRLDIFRLLVGGEPLGFPAGELARRLTVPQNTLSGHLGILSRAGLVTSQRLSRSIVYRANVERLQATILFLLKDCCGGSTEICAPLIADLTPCRTQKAHAHD
ncbi:ArsR/SmtB family transcription factor [Microvirga aerophila]|nr:metalloregulator ArsR/SmtB family transcription factor [Microvirga aerophila]